jgi:hypothetical protein
VSEQAILEAWAAKAATFGRAGWVPSRVRLNWVIGGLSCNLNSPPQLATRDRFALRVDSVNLKHVLCQMTPTRVAVFKFSIDLPMDGFP